MKTIGFGKINVSHTPEGECILMVSSPQDGEVTLRLTADELMMFMVEVGNGLKDARAMEVKKIIERDLRKEERR